MDRFIINTSGANWWSTLEQIQMAPPSGQILCIHMCIVFALQLIRAKEVRIYKEVKRSEEK